LSIKVDDKLCGTVIFLVLFSGACCYPGPPGWSNMGASCSGRHDDTSKPDVDRRVPG